MAAAAAYTPSTPRARKGTTSSSTAGPGVSAAAWPFRPGRSAASNQRREMEGTLALIREDVKNAPEYDCERGFDAAFRAELNTCFGHARRPPAIENESNDNLAPLLNDDEARHLLDRWRGLRRGIEAGDLAAVNAADRLV